MNRDKSYATFEEIEEIAKTQAHKTMLDLSKAISEYNKLKKKPESLKLEMNRFTKIYNMLLKWQEKFLKLEDKSLAFRVDKINEFLAICDASLK